MMTLYERQIRGVQDCFEVRWDASPQVTAHFKVIRRHSAQILEEKSNEYFKS